MFLSIRTTIFWNLFLLMTLAIILIGLVVIRVTERQISEQYSSSAQMIFTTLQSHMSLILQRNPEFMYNPSGESDLQKLCRLFINKGICRHILLVNNKDKVIAHTDKTRVGELEIDRDIARAMSLKILYKKISRRSSLATPQLVIAGPVTINGRQTAMLKTVFSLQDAQEGIKSTSKLILLYIIFDAIILIAFGTFLLSRYLAKPIKKLIKLTENIAEGQLDGTPLFLSEKNEIGKLSSALKNMSEKLKEERTKIQEQFHALEEKNRQLQQAHQEIIQSEKLASVGRLATGIAHEIGNPIGIILGYVHMLRQKNIEDLECRDYIKRIDTETDRVNTIIRDLLDYAQPSTQEIQMINVNTVIKDTYALVSYQKEFNTIEPVFSLADELPVLYANEKLIRQLIVNLTLNAKDAMPDGGTLTFTTCRSGEGPQDKILFTISDTGEGISPENLGKIFDPFFTTKEQGKGTGLGLANVHRIVELCSGTISVASTPGQGTTFSITFPAAPS